MDFLFVLQMMAFWYGLLVLVVWLVAVLVFRKIWRARSITLAVLALALLPPIYLFRDQPEAVRQQNAETEDLKKRYIESKTMFDELCKGAGIKVIKKPKRVDGILLKMPMNAKNLDALGSQYYPSAALSSAWFWEVQVAQLLGAERTDPEVGGSRGTLEASLQKGNIAGFSWVEISDLSKGGRARYINDSKATNGIREVAAGDVAPRYEIDISFDVDPVKRERWIAGAEVTVFDRENGETIATLRRYIMDPVQGNQENGRSTWGLADRNPYVCPAREPVAAGAELRLFVSDLFSFSAIK